MTSISAIVGVSASPVADRVAPVARIDRTVDAGAGTNPGLLGWSRPAGTSEEAFVDSLRLRRGQRSPRPSGATTWSPTPDVLDAARSMGVRPDASQAEIDARFRAIVKSERPDLGNMDSEAFAQLLDARRVLAQRARPTAQASMLFSRWVAAAPRGTVIDLRA